MRIYKPHKLLDEEAFHFSYDVFAGDGLMTTERVNFATVKAVFLEQFGCESNPKEITARFLRPY